MTTEPVHTDQELFQRISAGDESAFREIFFRYGPVLQPFSFRIVKDDAIAREIVQETFLRLWLRREGLANIEKPSSWIYRIASNLALTQLKRQQLEARILHSIAPPADSPSPTTEFDGKELQELIHTAVSRLPPQRRRIFQMSREQGLSRREIAETLHISENTVKNQLGLSLREIQAFIQNASGYYIPAILILTALSACAQP